VNPLVLPEAMWPVLAELRGERPGLGNEGGASAEGWALKREPVCLGSQCVWGASDRGFHRRRQPDRGEQTIRDLEGRPLLANKKSTANAPRSARLRLAQAKT
jgi:hypothetical protein